MWAEAEKCEDGGFKRSCSLFCCFLPTRALDPSITSSTSFSSDSAHDCLLPTPDWDTACHHLMRLGLRTGFLCREPHSELAFPPQHCLHNTVCCSRHHLPFRDNPNNCGESASNMNRFSLQNSTANSYGQISSSQVAQKRVVRERHLQTPNTKRCFSKEQSIYDTAKQ